MGWIIHQFLKLLMCFGTIENCNALAIKLPCLINELQAFSDGFNGIKGSDGLFGGCIGANDGWLCGTTQSIDLDIINECDHFSRHCQQFSLNIAPGETGDHWVLFKCTQFSKWMQKHLSNSWFFWQATMHACFKMNS